MTTLLDDIEDECRALDKLAKAAKKHKSVTLSPGEAKLIQKHIDWLARERESLISSLPDDD
jgi:hypothetical protein